MSVDLMKPRVYLDSPGKTSSLFLLLTSPDVDRRVFVWVFFFSSHVFLLTESLAFLRSWSSSPITTAAGSTTSFSKHAEPREELLCWYVISWDIGSLGLPCAVSSGLLPEVPEAALRLWSRGCPSLLVPGTASDFLSPSNRAGVEHRFGCDDENTLSNCFFFLLNIHSPDSFLLPSAPPAPRRSDPSLGLSHGLVLSWKFFHILRW